MIYTERLNCSVIGCILHNFVYILCILLYNLHFSNNGLGFYSLEMLFCGFKKLSIFLLLLLCPVVWGCRIHRLLFSRRGKNPHQRVSSLPLLPGTLWPGVVAPHRVLSMHLIFLIFFFLNWFSCNCQKPVKNLFFIVLIRTKCPLSQFCVSRKKIPA